MPETTTAVHDDVAYWLDEIEACRKRESDFRKDGVRICEIYEAAKTEATPFNILFSNTETIVPALYSATPRPVVSRRFKDDDPTGKAAADAGRRMLEFQLDTNLEGYETFDDVMKAATLTAALPGRAYTYVKYDAEVVEQSPEEGAEPEPIQKKNELVCCDTKPWHRMFQGYALKWANVPWIAEELYVDKAEAVRLFGAKIAAKLPYTEGEPAAKEESAHDGREARHQGRRRTVQLYQIWDKEGGRKVRYISSAYPEAELLVKDDPLKLTGFFPCPRPLTLLDKVTSLTPTALYTLYETQARELNRLTVRISHVIEAIKARGAYDGSYSETLSKVFEGDDNMLVASENTSAMAFEKGFANAIWMLPIEQLIVVLEKLYLARESCKQVIYEITGISDILRGATKASETLGAQKIKTQWGTLRLKNKQKEVARYARDLLRMMLEVAATQFSQETWAQMTGLPFLLDAKFNELTAVSQALTQAVQRVQASLPPPPPGAPPPPPPPEVQQLQQIQQQLQAPKWADVLVLLQNDFERAYRVDIETNSTVEPEAAEDKENIVDLMTVLGQYLQGVTPLITSGALPFQAAQTMMLTIARRFRFGSEIEESLKAMQPPTPEGDGGAAAAQKAEGEKMQMQQQMAQKDLQQQQESGQTDLKVKGMQQDQQHAERRTEQDVRELKLQHAEELLSLHQKAAQESLQQRDAVSSHKLQSEKKVAALENSKYKTENVVNQKADQTLTKGIKQMEGLVEQMARMVTKLTLENRAIMQDLAKAITAPRTRKAIRDKTGRIEAVEEQVT
jgi:hypothetical protein